jgi:hypothetical protein
MAKPDGRPNVSVADYVAPAGIADYVGAFAVTAGHGVTELVASLEAAHDDYSAILARALADRLAEAFAERMHERVRRELWGYAPDESLSNQDLIAERYAGIRPAPGYPATPDHTAKRTLFDLLEAEGRAAIRLTESCAMLPAASVSGLYFWHPDSRYFGIGRIGRDQLEDYARRAGCRSTRPNGGSARAWRTSRPGTAEFRPAGSRHRGSPPSPGPAIESSTGLRQRMARSGRGPRARQAVNDDWLATKSAVTAGRRLGEGVGRTMGRTLTVWRETAWPGRTGSREAGHSAPRV